MLSLKLPRLFSIDQMPEVCAFPPKLEFHADLRAWPLLQPLLCVQPVCSAKAFLFMEALSDSFGELEPPVSSTYPKTGNGSDPETVRSSPFPVTFVFYSKQSLLSEITGSGRGDEAPSTWLGGSCFLDPPTGIWMQPGTTSPGVWLCCPHLQEAQARRGDERSC